MLCIEYIQINGMLIILLGKSSCLDDFILFYNFCIQRQFSTVPDGDTSTITM